MARCFGSSRILWSNGSGLTEREQVQEAPAWNWQQARQPAMHRQQRARVPTDQAREYRHRRKNPVPRRERESGALGQRNVVSGGPIARMLVLRCCPDQAAL